MATRTAAFRRSRARAAGPFDITFYMPTAGALLAAGPAPPPGGAERQVVALAEGFANRGRRVGVIAFDPGCGLATEAAGIRVIGQDGVVCTVPGVRTAELYVRTAASLARARAGVFVQRAAGPHTGLVAVVARVLGRRFVYSSANVIDFDYASLERRRWNVWLYELGVRLADQVVVQTPEQVALCRQRFGREPVMIKSIAEPAALRAATPEAFLWIGRLAHYKQPLAYVELARALPQARFWMVAVPSGPDAPALQAQLERAAGELDNLTLLAPRPRAQLAPLIERAVAIVNTSDYEGMPNVFLEGWAQGVPALALHHDPDGVITRHQLGSYAHSSPTELIDSARELWDTRHDQTTLAHRCQTYITTEHSPHTITTQWLAMLDRVTTAGGVR